jgi:precorrin-2/cobalt-factor-2 C20-methyltransferase
MPNQRILRLADLPDGEAPYFAIVIVHGHGRRPEVEE